MSVKTQIMTAFAQRLATITAANGYSTDVKKVFYDKIPMGLEAPDYQLPAIYMLDKDDSLSLKINRVEGRWEFYLQIWHKANVADSVMLDFVADIMKAVFANSPTQQTHGAFKAIHPKIYQVIPLSVTGDLQMIDANRVYDVRFLVVYETELYNM